MSEKITRITGLFSNWPTAAGALIAALLWANLALGMARIDSPRTGKPVTRAELIAETVTVEHELAARQDKIDADQQTLNRDYAAAAEVYKIALDQVDQKEQRAAGWLKLGAGLATTAATGGSVDIAQLLASAFGLIGIGATAGATAAAGGKAIRKIRPPTPKPPDA